MTGHPLEQATVAALQETVEVKRELAIVGEALKQAEEMIAHHNGVIDSLHSQLEAAKARGDHYLRWNTEITKQLHNIGMFVQDALEIARQEVKKVPASNGGDPEKTAHLGNAAIAKALAQQP